MKCFWKSNYPQKLLRRNWPATDLLTSQISFYDNWEILLPTGRPNPNWVFLMHIICLTTSATKWQRTRIWAHVHFLYIYWEKDVTNVSSMCILTWKEVSLRDRLVSSRVSAVWLIFRTELSPAFWCERQNWLDNHINHAMPQPFKLHFYTFHDWRFQQQLHRFQWNNRTMIHKNLNLKSIPGDLATLESVCSQLEKGMMLRMSSCSSKKSASWFEMLDIERNMNFMLYCPYLNWIQIVERTKMKSHRLETNLIFLKGIWLLDLMNHQICWSHRVHSPRMR